jgi:uncharacterized protein (TIGR00369 family)
MDERQRRVQDGIVLSPFGNLVGLVCDEVGDDRVRVRLPFRKQVTTVSDLVHGGAIASLVDVAATAAAWSARELPPNARGTTIGFSLSFLEGGRGEDLVATAQVIRRGRSMCFIDVDVRGRGERLVARATVTYKLSSASG